MSIEYIAIGEKIISNLSLELILKEIHERITNVYYTSVQHILKVPSKLLMQFHLVNDL